jgi:hypothetical protein
VHSRLAELLEYAAAQRRVLLDAVSSVPVERRERRPAPDAWSVAEVLEHLHRTETGVALLVTARLAEARQAGLPPERETASLLGALDRFRIAERGRLVAAPSVVQPTGTMGSALVLERLAVSREALLHALAPGNGLALGGVLHAHPFLGALSIYQWVLFVAQHEARHAIQIRSAAGGPEISR